MGKARKRSFRRWLAEFSIAAFAGPIVAALAQVWFPVFQDQIHAIIGVVVLAIILALAYPWFVRRLGHEINPAQAAGTFLLLSPAIIIIIAMAGDQMIVFWVICAIVASAGIFSVVRLVNRRDHRRIVESAAPSPDGTSESN